MPADLCTCVSVDMSICKYALQAVKVDVAVKGMLI